MWGDDASFISIAATNFYIGSANYARTMKKELKVKSIAALVPAEKVYASLLEMGFSLQGVATTVSDGRFWKRTLFVRRDEAVSLSDEIGDAYPKDPIITIYGSNETISKISEVVD